MKKTLLFFALTLTFMSKAQLNNFSVGQAAPNFTVTDLHGHTHNLSDYAGKWVMIDFFAYWCGPCAATAPIINDFYKKYGCNTYDIVVLALEGEGTTAQTQAFEDANGGDANFPTPTVSGLNGGADAVHAVYGPAAFPTIIIVGPDGLIKNEDLWPISSITSIETAFTSAGASSAMVVNSCSVAGVEELQLTSNAVYPNPTKGNLNFKITSSNTTDLELNVYSVQGSKLLSVSNQKVVGGENNIALDLSDLSEGHYFLESKSTEGFSVRTAFQVVK